MAELKETPYQRLRQNRSASKWSMIGLTALSCLALIYMTPSDEVRQITKSRQVIEASGTKEMKGGLTINGVLVDPEEVQSGSEISLERFADDNGTYTIKLTRAETDGIDSFVVDYGRSKKSFDVSEAEQGESYEVTAPGGSLKKIRLTGPEKDYSLRFTE